MKTARIEAPESLCDLYARMSVNVVVRYRADDRSTEDHEQSRDEIRNKEIEVLHHLIYGKEMEKAWKSLKRYSQLEENIDLGLYLFRQIRLILVGASGRLEPNGRFRKVGEKREINADLQKAVNNLIRVFNNAGESFPLSHRILSHSQLDWNNSKPLFICSYDEKDDRYYPMPVFDDVIDILVGFSEYLNRREIMPNPYMLQPGSGEVAFGDQRHVNYLAKRLYEVVVDITAKNSPATVSRITNSLIGREVITPQQVSDLVNKKKQ